jgi:hypothetical protein
VKPNSVISLLRVSYKNSFLRNSHFELVSTAYQCGRRAGLTEINQVY